MTKLQSNDHNFLRLITPGKAAFTLHTTDRLFAGHAQSVVHNAMQLFDRQSLRRRLEMLDDPSIRSSSDHQYYPAFKLSLKPTSAPFGLASACNNTSCLPPLLRQWPKGRLRTTTGQLVVFANSVLATLDPCKVLTLESYMAELSFVYGHNVCVHVTHIGNGKVVGIVY